MVAAALDHPGLRLTAAELVALRPPARAGRETPASRRPGALASRAPGQGMDLREIRAFAQGDDLRRLDPSATARTGQLHVRSFHDDRDDSTLLIADFRPAMLWGTGTALRSVRGARALARIGWQGVARGGSVALVAVGDGPPALLAAGTGAAQMQAVAAALARVHDAALARAAQAAGRSSGQASGPAQGLAPVLAQARRLAPPGAQVHLATGPEGLEGADAALARLARGRRVSLHLILDPAETAPPAAGLAVHDGRAARHGRLCAHDPLPLMARLRGLGLRVATVLPDDTG
ncbi:Protein of unknown function DUF58 [Paracoccus thiocyanatus]|uniref:DUF58 domain-containing protein n=1 Tax=Paracoccus thiocyanatus TaxID=34006 RepID=A0A1N6WIQ2_9RHOB|nr:DUF58 domain-containing protein [Paracoccus thiocyanatus]SIQ89979.1 Protein of unknown function DUF58 [Paracoccus thiocyanatus]